MTTKAANTKRVAPLSVKIYFSEEQREIYDLIQVTAKQYHQSVSNLCAMSVSMGFRTLYDVLNTLPLSKSDVELQKAPVTKRIMPDVKMKIKSKSVHR